MDQSVRTLPSDGADGRSWAGRIIIAVILGEAIWGLIVSVMNNVVVPWLGDVMGQSSGLPTSFTQRPYNYPELFVSIFEFCIACLVAAILNYFFQRLKAARVRSAKSSLAAVPATPIRVIPQVVPSPPPAPVPVNQVAASQPGVLQLGVPQFSVAEPRMPQPSQPQPNVPQTRAAPASVPQASPPPPPQPPSPVPPPAPVMKPQPVISPAPAAVAPATPAPLAAPPVPPEAASRPVVAVTPPASASANAEAAKPAPPKAEPVKPKKPKQVYYNIVGEPMPSDDD